MNYKHITNVLVYAVNYNLKGVTLLTPPFFFRPYDIISFKSGLEGSEIENCEYGFWIVLLSNGVVAQVLDFTNFVR